jgi:chromosomal replication initiator protein
MATKTSQDHSTNRTPGLNPAWTFDAFVVGPFNVLSFKAAQSVAGTQKLPCCPLFIYGEVGMGKTHLLHAIGNHLSATTSMKVCNVSSEDFANGYITALQQRELVQFRARYRTTDVLLLDAVQFLAGKERLQEEFLHTFDVLHDAGKTIVITANCPPSHITGLTADLVSRLESGLCVEMDCPDLDTRLAILRRKLKTMQASIPEDCLVYIATAAGLNVRRLEGALFRAVSYQTLIGKSLTLQALKSFLKDLAQQNPCDK